jgi:pimeloyl-ACP methyl ester carboxylesterase
MRPGAFGERDMSRAIPAHHPFRSPEARRRYLALYDALAEKWPSASDSRMVETSYGRTFVRITGPAAAEPLVLLHGGGGNSLQWLPNIRALSGNFRTYAPDNIFDTGRSIYSRAVRDADGFVAWLDDLLDTLAPGGPIHLAGLSYGGWISARYALRRQERLGRLILLAPAGTVLPLSAAFMLRAVTCLIPHRYFTRRFFYWLLEDLVRKGASVGTFLEEHIEESYVAQRCFKPKRMVTPTALTDAELQSIRLPTLCLVGEHEKIYSAKEAVRRLNAVAPRIVTDVIPGAGHDLTVVQADMVNARMLAFLGQS